MSRRKDTHSLSIAECTALDNEQARRNAEEREPQQRIDSVVAAIEAFTYAKIVCVLASKGAGPMSSYRLDVTETREHLSDKLRELLE